MPQIILLFIQNISVSDWLKSLHNSSQPAIVDQMCKNFVIRELMTSTVQQNCQIIEPLTGKIWGQG